MSFLEGGVIGFNNPSSFALVDGKLFIPAGNGILITHNNEFHFWQPTRGQYEITNVVSNEKGVLCLAEKKLSVSLYFYQANDLRQIGEVSDVATTQIDMMCFSYDCESLFVLYSIPSCAVQVIRVANGKFSKTNAVHFSGIYTHAIIPARFTQRREDFIVVHNRGFSGYSLKGKEYNECISSSEVGNDICCGVAVNGGILLGSREGKIYHYDYTKRCSTVIVSLSESDSSAITALEEVDKIIYVGTDSGNVYEYHLGESLSFLVDIGSCVRRFAPSKLGMPIYIGAIGGLFQLEVQNGAGIIFNVKMRSSEVVKCLAADGNCLVAACKNGSFYTVSLDSSSTTYWNPTEQHEVLDACLLDKKKLLLGCASGELFCFDIYSGRLLWSTEFPQFCCSMCECNKEGQVVVAHSTSLRLLKTNEETGYEMMGMIRVQGFSKINVVHWVPKENRFIVAFKNGEAHMFNFPEEAMDMSMEYGSEMMLERIWRLDFPVTDFVCLYSEPDVINILVHSADKDTKLYALERKRDGDGKLLRPLFRMRDHDSGGARLLRFNSTTIFSGGKDGRVILRDIEHYQTKLASIPPSKEKRKPIFDKVVRPFTAGGVTIACVLGNGLLACGGHKDTVIQIIPTLDRGQLRWKEQQTWICRRRSDQPKKLSESMEGDMEAHEKNRKKLLRAMEQLRVEWRGVMDSMDVDVPVDALLLPDRREAFNDECIVAVERMKEDIHFHSLLNQYVQYNIRKYCWDTMAVVREKVVSLTDLKVEVHNYHLLKSVVAKEPLYGKILFLRNMQCRVGEGHQLKPLRSAASPSSRTRLLTTDDYKSTLYSPFDVYTHTRAILQSLLLQGRILHLKTLFNQGFNDLREMKKMVMAQIEERTKRCVKIMKQLGEQPSEFFQMAHDYEENPLTVFEVKDEELPEDVQGLVEKKSDLIIVSPSNEAALKLWMDGLEKDVELLEVRLPPPEFADESKEGFIPPEERTEDQSKIYEDYEKKLKEEVEKLNIKKDALRNEFKMLQNENSKGAKHVDETLKALRHRRLISAEEINECEMQVVNLLQQLLRSPAAFRNYEKLDAEKVSLQRTLRHIETLLTAKRELFVKYEDNVKALMDENGMLLENVRSEEPFTDPGVGERLYRRFTRWKRKFDEGKASINDAKKTDEMSDATWEAYYSHCTRSVELRECLREAIREMDAQEQSLKAMEEGYANIAANVERMEDRKEEQRRSYLKDIMNTSSLYALHQGQIQDESAIMVSDFSQSCLRYVSDVQQYNDLVLASDAENATLLERIIKRRKLMKFLSWETKRLNYCIGTFELELRQLHTLRVTRQMQEWLQGDAEISEEKAIESIERHIRYVNQTMNQKVQALQGVAGQVKAQIRERMGENAGVQKQSNELRDCVEDKKSVKELVDSHADESMRATERAKEIYETSELEELARNQQEELIRLKREVDRLRERTFPSFVVVSKNV